MRYGDSTRGYCYIEGKRFQCQQGPDATIYRALSAKPGEALGTIFNVRANPDSVRVDVLEGRSCPGATKRH